MNADYMTSLGGEGVKSLSATSFNDYSALVGHQSLCEKGSFPLWGLLGKAFVIVYG